MKSHHTRFIVVVLPLVTLALQALPARAEEEVVAPNPELTAPPGEPATRWALGLGVGIQRQPYTDADTKTRVLPLVFYENRYVRLIGLGGELKLGNAGPVRFGLRLRYSPQGYEASDARILSGMAERKAAVLAGGALDWRTPLGIVSAEAVGDVSGNSRGAQARLGFDAPYRLGAFSLTPHVSATWLDRKTVAYYYGVRASEVRVDRAQYEGRSTVNTEIGLRTGYALAPNQTVTLDLGATLFGSGIKDSPLVDRSTQANLRLAYIYRF